MGAIKVFHHIDETITNSCILFHYTYQHIAQPQTVEMSYHPCRGSYWAWVDSWLCLSAAMISPPHHLNSLLPPGIKLKFGVINETALIITIKNVFVWLCQQSLSSSMMATRCLLTLPHLCSCSCTTGSRNVSSWSNQQRHKSVSNTTATSGTKALSDDDAIEPNSPTVWNTDISQIKYSWQELNWSSWYTGTLIESIAGFLNAARGVEAGSADPKWS